MPLSSSSIIWYWPKGGWALWLGRQSWWMMRWKVWRQSYQCCCEKSVVGKRSVSLFLLCFAFCNLTTLAWYSCSLVFHRDCLPSHSAQLPFGQYLIMLLDDRGTCTKSCQQNTDNFAAKFSISIFIQQLFKKSVSLCITMLANTNKPLHENLSTCDSLYQIPEWSCWRCCRRCVELQELGQRGK